MSSATAMPMDSGPALARGPSLLQRDGHDGAAGRETETGIVGASPVFQDALQQARIVAPTDSTVVIHGETGTGKEVFAGLIHELSRRSGGPFVPVNCAAIPEGLFESELFGHERGAFTNAIAQRIGRFEAANHGTVFLDEIGDLPTSVQTKLLRVLQEREFERVGGARTMRVDVRVIAATNRDLSQLVEEQTFRIDLFYRLNVFPISLPPLRSRREDIPSLVRHFVQKTAERIGRHVETIPPESMRTLIEHNWPGNVRELQNVIERAVILSENGVLRVPALNRRDDSDCPGSRRNTLNEREREFILDVLDETHWTVGGRDGAARRLGIPRTTLISKMKKLGITHRRSVRPTGTDPVSPPVSQDQPETPRTSFA
jgi:transcriptional regulator with GAF, ATPase, and Fis domain